MSSVHGRQAHGDDGSRRHAWRSLAMTVVFGTALATAGCGGADGNLEAAVARDCERLGLFSSDPRNECACLARGFVVAVAEGIRDMTEEDAHNIARMLAEVRTRNDLGFQSAGRYHLGTFDETARRYDLSSAAWNNFIAFSQTCWQSDARSWDD